MSIIEVQGLQTGYGSKILYKDLSFTINKPTFVGILGRNGSGKSTFLRSLINKQPFLGSISLEGQNIYTLSREELSLKTSFLQQKNLINFPIPVRELVVMGNFRNKKFFQVYTDKDYNVVNSILSELKLSEFENRNFTELSGGEQQLVWIAQLMLQNTSIWLLDEPTQQLDLYRKKQIFLLFNRMVKEKNKTILCVTHDVSYLELMEGYFINLTSKHPRLEEINSDNLKAAIEVLESQ